MELLDTLVGAIVGALFAVGTTAWFFRAEGRRNYNGRLDDALVAIGFTSGSTGQPGAHPKPWGALVAGISLTVLVWIVAYAVGGGR